MLTLMVHQVAQTLREAHCGRQNNQPLVLCNDEEEEEEEVLEPHSRENLIRYGLMMSNLLYICSIIIHYFPITEVVR